MAQHPPFPLTFVEGFQQFTQGINGILIGDLGGPPPAQKRAKNDGAEQGSHAHEADKALKFVRLRERRDDSQREPKEQSDKGPCLKAGFQTDSRRLGLAMTVLRGRKSLKPCVVVKRIKGFGSLLRIWSETDFSTDVGK